MCLSFIAHNVIGHEMGQVGRRVGWGDASVRAGLYEQSSRAIRAVGSVVTYGRVRRCDWLCKVDHLGGPPILT